MTDPFSADEDEDDISPLINIATFVRMSVALAERLVSSLVNGTAQMTMFVEEQRLNTNSTNCWYSLPNLNIKTFASLVKKKTVKLVDEKVLTTNADRELFGRLVIAAKSRDINLKYVLSYELSTVPFYLARTDGRLRKTNKSVIMTELEKKLDVQLKLPQVTTSTEYTAHIFDAMALVHKTNSIGTSTFGENNGIEILPAY